MWIVSPGNVTQGVLYNVTVNTVAGFISALPVLNAVIITSGATIGSPYAVATTNTRVLFNKTVSSPSFATCPIANTVTYGHSIFFKDLKGDAATNPITIRFTGGELCDGLTQLVIANPFGWVEVTPVPGGGAWYQSQ